MITKLSTLPIFAAIISCFLSACKTPPPPPSPPPSSSVVETGQVSFQPFTSSLANQLGSDKLARGLQYYVSSSFSLEEGEPSVRTEVDSQSGKILQIQTFHKETITIKAETGCIVTRTERTPGGLNLMASFEEGKDDLTLSFMEGEDGLFVLAVSDDGGQGFYLNYNGKRYSVICDQLPYLLIRIDNINDTRSRTKILGGRKLP